MSIAPKYSLFGETLAITDGQYFAVVNDHSMLCYDSLSEIRAAVALAEADGFDVGPIRHQIGEGDDAITERIPR